MQYDEKGNATEHSVSIAVSGTVSMYRKSILSFPTKNSARLLKAGSSICLGSAKLNTGESYTSPLSKKSPPEEPDLVLTIGVSGDSPLPQKADPEPVV